MKLFTKDGRKIENLEALGTIWAETLIKSGIDEVIIDLGVVSIFNNFMDSIILLDVLTHESVERLGKEVFNSHISALVVEEGAKLHLLENGYVPLGDHSFKRKEDIIKKLK